MATQFQTLREEATRSENDFVVEILNLILAEAARRNVSDVHFQPGKSGIDIRFRENGVLQPFGLLEPEFSGQLAARIKILAHLLTYKTDVPQEGRVRSGVIPNVDKELRISTVATLYGERVAVRFFGEENQYRYPNELGFSQEILEELLLNLRRNSGAILITGPSGSGKTTTAYALLRELSDPRLAADPGSAQPPLRSIISLEDPIEHALNNVAQVEVNERSPVPLNEMIKYMLRQDPEVLFVGEIRDRKSADTALQAALTGHLLITTFHAGSAVDALGRLCELGIEPFVLRSSVAYVLCQRLVRRLCPKCADVQSKPIKIPIANEVFECDTYAMPKGCADCNETGYVGRILLAEALPMNDRRLLTEISDRTDTHSLQVLARELGMVSMPEKAAKLLREKITSPMEIRRVFG